MCWRWDLNCVLNDVKDLDVAMRENDDRGHDEDPHLMGKEAPTFTRKGGQGEERGTNSPRAAKLDRRGGMLGM